MIEITYDNDTEIVRSNIGDPQKKYVSDKTIFSALSVTGDDVVKASIMVMETMLNWFSTLADESKTDQVEIKYKGLYERYKARLQEFKNENNASKSIPIIIGGTSLKERNRITEDTDSFTPLMNDDWLTLKQRVELVEDNDRFNN